MPTLYAPVTHGDPVEHRRLLANAANGALNGKINSVGSFTITASAGSTDVTDFRVGNESVVVFMAETASAATELASGSMYVSSKNITAGTFTVDHTNSAVADRDFRYAVLG